MDKIPRLANAHLLLRDVEIEALAICVVADGIVLDATISNRPLLVMEGRQLHTPS